MVLLVPVLESEPALALESALVSVPALELVLVREQEPGPGQAAGMRGVAGQVRHGASPRGAMSGESNMMYNVSLWFNIFYLIL